MQPSEFTRIDTDPTRQATQLVSEITWKRAVVAVLTASAIVTGVATTHEPVSEPAPIQSAESVAHPLPRLGAAECPAIDPSAIAAAEQLIDQPANPDIAIQQGKLPQTLNDKTAALLSQHAVLSPKMLALEVNSSAAYTIDHHAAERYGLDVYDPAPYLEHIDTLSQEQAPFGAYLETAQAYMQHFGLTARVGTQSDKFDLGLRAPQPDELETDTAKGNVIEIIRGLSAMPRQYIELNGLRTIILAAGPDSYYGAYATIDGAHDAIVLNMSGFVTDDNINHEITHIADAAECGGANGAGKDPAYTRNNTVPYTNGERSPQPAPDYITIQSTTGPSNVSEILAEQTGNKYGACLAERNTAAQLRHVSLATPYAVTNAYEDKAEAGKAITEQNDWIERADPRMPALRAKFMLLLARLVYYAPKVAEYFAAIAPRSTPTNPCSLTYQPPQPNWTSSRTFGSGK